MYHHRYSRNLTLLHLEKKTLSLVTFGNFWEENIYNTSESSKKISRQKNYYLKFLKAM